MFGSYSCIVGKKVSQAKYFVNDPNETLQLLYDHSPTHCKLESQQPPSPLTLAQQLQTSACQDTIH